MGLGSLPGFISSPHSRLPQGSPDRVAGSFKRTHREFPVVQQVKDPALSLLWLWVTAVAWAGSLALEFHKPWV